MDILMICQYFPPDWNGASARAYNAARGLVFQGCNVTVITAFPHYPDGHIPSKYKKRIIYLEEIDGIKLVRTWVPSLAHLPIAKRILLHISFMISSLFGFLYIRKLDMIFAMNPSLFSFFPALVYKIFFRKNIIRNVDDLWPEAFYDLGIVKSKFFKRILDFAASISYRIPVAIIPVSHGYIQTLTTKYCLSQEKIVVIEHGVDTTRFHRLKTNSSNRKCNKKAIMYSGNLNLGYDFETVFRAAKLLELEPVYFIIRGIGVLSDKVSQMVKDYDVKNVDVRTDLLSQEQLVSVLNSADIFVLPMNLDARVMDQGLPTKLLEYQALAKPIVCISDGEAGKYIRKTQSGLVTATRKPEELAHLIMQLVNDENLAKTLGNNGFNNINNNLTLEMVGKRFMDVITRSLQSTK